MENQWQLLFAKSMTRQCGKAVTLERHPEAKWAKICRSCRNLNHLILEQTTNIRKLTLTLDPKTERLKEFMFEEIKTPVDRSLKTGWILFDDASQRIREGTFLQQTLMFISKSLHWYLYFYPICKYVPRIGKKYFADVDWEKVRNSDKSWPLFLFGNSAA